MLIAGLKKTIATLGFSLLKVYWSIFRVPVVVNLLFDENYTQLNWDKYFLFNYKNLYRGYLKYSRQAFIELASIDAETEKQIDLLALDKYRSFNYKNINLWEVCKASILSDLNNPILEVKDKDALECVKNYYRESIKYINATLILVENKNVVCVLLSQGATYGDRFYADNNCGMILNRHALGMPIWSRASARELTEKQKNRLKQAVSELYKRKGAEHVNDNELGIDDIYQNHNIKGNRKVAVLIGQVMSDGF